MEIWCFRWRYDVFSPRWGKYFIIEDQCICLDDPIPRTSAARLLITIDTGCQRLGGDDQWCWHHMCSGHPGWKGALTHWGRVPHICVSKLTIIGSDNGLSPGRRQAIIWTNAEILWIGPLGTSLNEILIEIHIFHSRKCVWKYRLRNGGHFVSASMCSPLISWNHLKRLGNIDQLQFPNIGFYSETTLAIGIA